MSNIRAAHFARLLLHLLNRGEALIAALCLMGVTGLLIADVFSRQILGQSILGAPQIAVLLAAVAAFLGYGIATGAGTHLRPNLLDWVFPKNWDATIGRLAQLISAIAFFSLGIAAITFVMASYQWGDRVEVFYIYLWPFQSVIPYALFSCALRHAICFAFPDLTPHERMAGTERNQEMPER